MPRVNFDKGWSRLHRFTGGKDNPDVISRWSCRGKSGIYLISDGSDYEILYVGKANSIDTRLQEHMEAKGYGNARIAADIASGKTFTLRWILSRDPDLSESIAIVVLTPRYNGRCEWKRGVDKVDLLSCLQEAERIGLVESKEKVEENLILNLCNALEIRISELRHKKSELCNQAEALSNSTNWKDGEERLKKMQAEWKKLGFAGKFFDDVAWGRFKYAIDTFYERRRAYFARKKSEFCSQVEALNKSDKWKEAEEGLKQLQSEWKQLGSAGKEFDEAIWFRFKNSIDAFYERRKAHFAQKECEYEENKRKKEQLCREAESLLYFTDWKKAGDTFKALSVRWKSTGSAGRDHEEKLWQRFKSARDKFHERRSEYFNHQEREQLENLDRKLRMCAEAEDISAIGARIAGNVRDSVQRIKQLQADWKTIGHVPRDRREQVQDRFRQACNKVFEWDRQERERKQAEWREKMKEIIANKKEQANRIRDSIRHDEQIINQKWDTISNLRPGGRASEIREHLEEQIRDIQRKIDSKYEKVRDIESSIRDLEIKVYGF
ncbi:DUF349 domain-containing protein [Microcoleus sp. LAD1_D3]|uniref:DUF349 domain-containing protein n=1 Tax=Microcoleus sp. LAD1_D3 TaxID=2819365 RepID=UPI002FCEADA9